MPGSPFDASGLSASLSGPLARSGADSPVNSASRLASAQIDPAAVHTYAAVIQEFLISVRPTFGIHFDVAAAAAAGSTRLASRERG